MFYGDLTPRREKSSVLKWPREYVHDPKLVEKWAEPGSQESKIFGR